MSVSGIDPLHVRQTDLEQSLKTRATAVAGLPSGASSPDVLLPVDVVSVSERGKKAAAGLRRPADGGPETVQEALKRKSEQKAGAEENTADEAGRAADGREGGAGKLAGSSGSGEPGAALRALQQKLEELQKQLGKLEEEITQLRSEGETENAEELEQKENEKQVLSGQIQSLTQQLRMMEQNGSDSGKSSGGPGPSER